MKELLSRREFLGLGGALLGGKDQEARQDEQLADHETRIGTLEKMDTAQVAALKRMGEIVDHNDSILNRRTLSLNERLKILENEAEPQGPDVPSQDPMLPANFNET